jgi:parallel beta-helix repeat protein
VPAKPHLRAARIAVVSFGAALALTVIAVMALSRADAAAKQLSCGDTITTDTTLESDLIDCPNNGVMIGADDVTLDLNGHLVDGDGTEFAGCDPNAEVCDSGIVDDGHDGVTVKHGRVREFGVGVLVGTSSAGKVRHNRLLDISSSKNLFFGIVVASSVQSVVRDGSSSHNIPPEGDGIGLFGSDHIKIADNSIKDNPGPGIHVADSDHNLIKGNLFSHSAGGVLIGGEDIGGSDRNEVRNNRFVHNGGGILISPGKRNVIARNRLSRDGSGIGIERGRHNLVARNLVVDPRGRGIRLGLDFADGSSVGGVDNIVRRNVVKRSGDDAFLINRKGASVLRRNVAKGAKDDGFDIESRSTRLTKNRAKHNADLGIEAVKGVIDGGGNRAGGNGDPRQCVNVKCH